MSRLTPAVQERAGVAFKKTVRRPGPARPSAVPADRAGGSQRGAPEEQALAIRGRALRRADVAHLADGGNGLRLPSVAVGLHLASEWGLATRFTL